mmetsp:Transcript_7333/g.24337  ORF Transcript_7333/g.24337 Transcript_7333/m.24337 type:complete len:845 (+) Transcript_7333:88-2622(+)|eukprot:CAMPEP_0170135116 /NCGR_PEP_ID=MMETSP0033_2-20121228/2314_1 /TAXON_ID=195969 /ORGANISM="Dolichomastix tenuilepis, Strain CCMP3274" /LENGTH=844 /DNA_ID=CAMNT_0010370711 /DNA_START=86 /DNA_END=2616 /DNA_ORIENTATION=+
MRPSHEALREEAALPRREAAFWTSALGRESVLVTTGKRSQRRPQEPAQTNGALGLRGAGVEDVPIPEIAELLVSLGQGVGLGAAAAVPASSAEGERAAVHPGESRGATATTSGADQAMENEEGKTQGTCHECRKSIPKRGNLIKLPGCMFKGRKGLPHVYHAECLAKAAYVEARDAGQCPACSGRCACSGGSHECGFSKRRGKDARAQMLRATEAAFFASGGAEPHMEGTGIVEGGVIGAVKVGPEEPAMGTATAWPRGVKRERTGTNRPPAAVAAASAIAAVAAATATTAAPTTTAAAAAAVAADGGGGDGSAAPAADASMFTAGTSSSVLALASVAAEDKDEDMMDDEDMYQEEDDDEEEDGGEAVPTRKRVRTEGGGHPIVAKGASRPRRTPVLAPKENETPYAQWKPSTHRRVLAAFLNALIALGAKHQVTLLQNDRFLLSDSNAPQRGDCRYSRKYGNKPLVMVFGETFAPGGIWYKRANVFAVIAQVLNAAIGRQVISEPDAHGALDSEGRLKHCGLLYKPDRSGHWTINVIKLVSFMKAGRPSKKSTNEDLVECLLILSEFLAPSNWPLPLMQPTLENLGVIPPTLAAAGAGSRRLPDDSEPSAPASPPTKEENLSNEDGDKTSAGAADRPLPRWSRMAARAVRSATTALGGGGGTGGVAAPPATPPQHSLALAAVAEAALDAVRCSRCGPGGAQAQAGAGGALFCAIPCGHVVCGECARGEWLRAGAACPHASCSAELSGACVPVPVLSALAAAVAPIAPPPPPLQQQEQEQEQEQEQAHEEDNEPTPQTEHEPRTEEDDSAPGVAAAAAAAAAFIEGRTLDTGPAQAEVEAADRP